MLTTGRRFYQSDALVSDKVKNVATAEEETHTANVYLLGIVKSSKNYDEAKELYTYLQK